MQLFGAKLGAFPHALVLGLGKRGFEEQLFKQITVIEVLGTAFKERERRQFRLLDVHLFGFLELEQRADVVGARRVNDDNTLALFELRDQVIPIHGGDHQNHRRYEEPEPREPVALHQKPREIKAACPGGHRTRFDRR